MVTGKMGLMTWSYKNEGNDLFQSRSGMSIFRRFCFKALICTVNQNDKFFNADIHRI